MRYLVLILALFAAPAQAVWSHADTARQGAYLALHAADWGQTRAIAASDNLEEYNPALGRDPSMREVNRYFAATALGHTAVSLALPAEVDWLGQEWHPRKVWQYLSIGAQANTVTFNLLVAY